MNMLLAGFVKGVLSIEESLPKSGLCINYLAIFSLGHGHVFTVSTHDLMFADATWSLTKMLSGPEEPSHSATVSVKSNHSRN